MGNDDAANREIISANVIETYNKQEAECKTKEDLGQKIDEGVTNKIKKLFKEDNNFHDHFIVVKDRCLKDFENKREIEELKERLKNRPTTRVEYQYYESEESKYYKQQMRIEEQNRKTASEELPNFLDIVKKDFYRTLNDKVMNIKENIDKQLSDYSSDNLKILSQQICEKEKLMDKLIEYIKKSSELIMEKYFKNSKHFNVLLLGKTGVGKSTLINGTLDLSENEKAKTGIGEPVTKEFDEYTSDKRKGLRLIDSRGIELEGQNIKVVFDSSKKLIEDRAKEGDPDKLIHCIWYCFKSSGLRFENCEKEILTLLMNQYDDNNLPIIIVITQNYIAEDTEVMIDYLKKDFQNREIIIMPVVAEKKNIGSKKNEIIVKKDGIEELIIESFEKSQKAVLPAVMKSIKEKIIQIFTRNIEIKKNKLKNDIKENIEKILKKIKEKTKIEKSISKLSTIIPIIFNMFLEFELNDENIINLENIENKQVLEAEEKKEEENLENIQNEENINKIENNIENNEQEEKKENNEEINNEEQNEIVQNEEIIPQQNEEQNQEQIQQEEKKEEIKENEEQNQEQIKQEEQKEEVQENEEQNQPQDVQEEQNEENEENDEESDDNEEVERNEIIENNKEEINSFLDDLCKWFIEKLNEIITDLINTNSNELGKLIFKEQVRVKQNRNVNTNLPNEQTIDQCIAESEQNLKPLITNKVYFSTLKYFYDLISEKLIEVCDVVITEQFNKIQPDLKNYISDEQLKKLSNEILEEILKNK